MLSGGPSGRVITRAARTELFLVSILSSAWRAHEGTRHTQVTYDHQPPTPLARQVSHKPSVAKGVGWSIYQMGTPYWLTLAAGGIPVPHRGVGWMS